MFLLTAEASKLLRASALTALVGAGLGLPALALAEGTTPPPSCRLDNAGATHIGEVLTAAARAYTAMGQPLLYDKVESNPAQPKVLTMTLNIYVVTDAAKGRTSPQGCSTTPLRKGDELDAISVRGGCVVVAVDRMEIRCSAETVRHFRDVGGNPGRAHPALLYVLAHEVGHLYQRRVGEYSGRVETIDLKAPQAAKLETLRSTCDPTLTKREEDADEMALKVLIKLVPAPPYREPLFSEQGSVLWAADQLNLAANTWQQSNVEREFMSQPKPHPSFVPREFPTPPATVEKNAKKFVCDVLSKSTGVANYLGRSLTHPSLEQRMRRVAEALKPIAASLPKTGVQQEYKPISVLQEQLSPIFSVIYKETGVYMDGLQSAICRRVNSDAPTAGCK
jgi:hypothetical protein